MNIIISAPLKVGTTVEEITYIRWDEWMVHDTV